MNRNVFVIFVLVLMAMITSCNKEPQITPPTPTNEKKVPIVKIYTDGKAPVTDKKNYKPGTLVILDPDGTYWDTPKFEARMGIRGRGNSTWNMDKKPYKIKFDEKQSIFGYAADKEWVLLANHADKSLLRNITAMKLSEIVGMEWTPAMLSVEVYFNDEYLGCYTFSEHKKVSKARVNLNIVEESDNEGDAVTGDYYFEIEQFMDETTCWMTERCRIPMMFSDPEVPTPAQLAYVMKYFADTEDALMGDDFGDPEKGYAKWIDVDSFINAYFVNEITKNVDGNMRKSSFITKKRGEKLAMYHVWDYDLTLGRGSIESEFFATNGPEGWFIQQCSYQEKYDPANKSTNWYVRLFQDPGFRHKVKERWIEIYPELLKVPDYIDENAEFIKGAQSRNFVKWPILSGTYQREVDKVKDFYTKRVVWMNTEIMKYE